MKATTASIMVVFAISLGIWTAYSFTAYPLDATGTIVVVGVVALAVASVRWLVAKLKRKGEQKKHE